MNELLEVLRSVGTLLADRVNIGLGGNTGSCVDNVFVKSEPLLAISRPERKLGTHLFLH